MSGEYVFLLGDMNARVGNTEIAEVVGKYGVEGVNENGQYLVDICAERGLFLSNTFLLSAQDDTQIHVGKGE